MIGAHESFTKKEIELLDLVVRRIHKAQDRMRKQDVLVKEIPAVAEQIKGMAKAIFIIKQIRQNGDVIHNGR